MKSPNRLTLSAEARQRRGVRRGFLARAWPALAILVIAPLMLHTLLVNPISAGEDDVGYYYPLRKMAGEAIAAGRLPLNNPLEATGGALFADPQSALMFPTTWLFAFLPPLVAYTISIYFAFWTAGGGMYVYLRSIGVRSSAAMFGTMAFMFCGFMVGHRVHLSMIQSAAFLPWLLLGVELTRRSLSASVLVLATGMFGSLAAGHFPTVTHMAIIVLAYGAMRARPLGRGLLAAAVSGGIAVLIAWPQLGATFRLMTQVTRKDVSYMVAGENSFFPMSAVLAFYPLIQGVRTGPVMWGDWWGSWHLCEMLPYVGLGTLVLAVCAVARLRQRTHAAVCEDLRPVVRCWMWLGAAAIVWMLGYYLPTYRLIHMLPVLGSVRCPARMILALDLALAALSAVALEGVIRGRDDFKLTIHRGIRRVLPWIMACCVPAMALGVAVLAALGLMGEDGFLFAGTYKQAFASLTPWRPGVLVPLLVLLVWAVLLPWWLKRPGPARTAALVLLLLADLFIVARSVDVPDDLRRPAELSPAAAWLKENAPGRYRVWGLANGYLHRSDELLLPKACCAMGISSIAGYGPFQTPEHGRLLGFDVAGKNEQWRWLVRTNHLLSLYGVRYLIVEDGSEHEQVLRDVMLGQGPMEIIGSNLLGRQWDLARSSWNENVLSMQGSAMYLPAVASVAVDLDTEKFYRIRLEVRADGGAAGWLMAQMSGLNDRDGRSMPKLFIPAEQISEHWRRFELIFPAPSQATRDARLSLTTMSERRIDLRDVRLEQCSGWWAVESDRQVQAPQAVYRQVAVLKALKPGDADVKIFENSLASSDVIENAAALAMNDDEIERLRWRPLEQPLRQAAVGIPPADLPSPVALAAMGCGLLLYICSVIAGIRQWGRCKGT